MFALKVTPKKVIFLFLILFDNSFSIFFVNNFFLFSFDLITDFITYNLNPVIVSTNVGQLTGPGATDGSVFLSVDSGLAPFTYVWEVTSTGVTDTSTNFNGIFTRFNLPADTYCVTIKRKKIK